MPTVRIGHSVNNINISLFTKIYTDEDDIRDYLYDDLTNPDDPKHHPRFDKLTPKEVNLLHQNIHNAYTINRGSIVDIGLASTRLWIQIV